MDKRHVNQKVVPVVKLRSMMFGLAYCLCTIYYVHSTCYVSTILWCVVPHPSLYYLLSIYMWVVWEH